MNLTEFIVARLDEDQAEAGNWRSGLPDVPDEMDVRWHKVPTYTPARVELEVAAKRRILAEVVEQIDDMDSRIEGEWGSGHHVTGESDLLLALLALPYSGHPDYRPEWAPAS